MNTHRLLAAALFLLVLHAAGQTPVTSLPGQSPKCPPARLQKGATEIHSSSILINDVFDYYSNDGSMSVSSYFPGFEGFEFPKGSGGLLMCAQGIIFGGYNALYNDTTKALNPVALKLSGSTYGYGLQPGPIAVPGTPTSRPVAADPQDPSYRVYRTRPDVNPGISKTAALYNITTTELPYTGRFEHFTVDEIYQQYMNDWNAWPASEGAPFTDIDSNGVYNPAIDIPGEPGADMTLWYVANDMNPGRHPFSYSSPDVMGMEEQCTIWACRGTGNPGLASAIFTRCRLINKSGARIDSMFISDWSDPDIGGGLGATHNLSGCDLNRSMGYVYNGPDCNPAPAYGCTPPAVGVMFLQGPLVKAALTDSARFAGGWRLGYKNLPWTSFSYFVCCCGEYSEPWDPDEYYRAMNGFGPTGQMHIDPTTGRPTMFVAPGDPVTGAGWVDGTFVGCGDRKMALNSGPFVMAPGDTQEIVTVTLVGRGYDRLSSITDLRARADMVRSYFTHMFAAAVPPPAPEVHAAELDGEIVLSWGEPASCSAVERWSRGGYRFEGYNVYQLTGPAFKSPTPVAVYDLVDGVTRINDYAPDPVTGALILRPVRFGTDAGVQHYHRTLRDSIGHGPLLNGTKYYFAVTSYSCSFEPIAVPRSLESAPVIVSATPQSSSPGIRYRSTTGQSVQAVHSAGEATGDASIRVIDPSAVKQTDYELRVSVTDSVFNDALGMNVANPKWTLFDVTGNRALTSPSGSYAVDGTNPVVGGVQIGLNAAPVYVWGHELISATWTGPTPYNLARVNPGSGGQADLSYALGIYAGSDFFGIGALSPPQVATTVQFEFVQKGMGQKAYDFLRTTNGSTAAPLIGYFTQPFNVWELNPDGTRRRQLDFIFMEYGFSRCYDSVWAPGASSQDREYWFVIAETYSPAPKSRYSGATLGSVLTADSLVWSGWNTLLDTTRPAYVPGDTWTLTATRILSTNDVWSFSTKSLAPTYSTGDAKADVDRITVFPNPYVRVRLQANDPSGHYVTFYHLPPKAVIRIYSIAGWLVKTIVKDDPGQFAQWDLRTEGGRTVAAGMFIAFIQMPDIGKTKTLKMAIIPDE